MSLKPAKDSVDVGIFVSDIKKSLDFYHGILGLEKIEELPTGFGTLHRLRFGTSDVKLMDPKKVPSAGAIGLEKQLGIRYLTFVIRDLAGLCAEQRISNDLAAVLEQNGLVFASKPAAHALLQLRHGHAIAVSLVPNQLVVQFGQQTAIGQIGEAKGHRASAFPNAAAPGVGSRSARMKLGPQRNTGPIVRLSRLWRRPSTLN